MAAIGYGICFVLSALVAVYLAQRNYDNIDSYYWTVVILIPVIIMGYWLKTQVASVEAAVALFHMINLTSTLLLAILLLSMLRDLSISTPSWLKAVLYGAVFAHMIIVVMLVRGDLSEGVIQVVDTGYGYAAKMMGSSFQLVHYTFLMAIAVVIVGVVAVSMAKRLTSSRRTLAVYAVLMVGGIVVYALESVLGAPFSSLPYLYVVGDVAIVLNYDHAHAHDISRLVSERQKHHTARGYIAIGLNGWFLSCNEKCYEFLPMLREQRVDEYFPEGSYLSDLLYEMIDDFNDQGVASAKFRSGDMTCACEISTFSTRKGGSARGYLIDIRDATEEQRTLDILADYNRTLNQEVAEKTEHIEQIQRQIVLGMANMVENRDSNTGGHVRRTSDIIQIIVEEIQAQGRIDLDDEMARDIVRAAPMHDLGKISIDSSILNKPGELTDEEYEIMKTHSTMSGQMVLILLDGVEEEHFVKTAYHVARFHHERWDGRGYPEGLVGEMIPLEARIMAVADVYDALVSARSYKDSLGFEEASEIMCEGMGTQFDPNMREVFLGCKEELEQYYLTQV